MMSDRRLRTKWQQSVMTFPDLEACHVPLERRASFLWEPHTKGLRAHQMDDSLPSSSGKKIIVTFLDI